MQVEDKQSQVIAFHDRCSHQEKDSLHLEGNHHTQRDAVSHSIIRERHLSGFKREQNNLPQILIGASSSSRIG
jgi:hypothetical protein